MGSEEAAQRDGDEPECIPDNDGSVDASKVESVLRRAETILAQRTDRILLVLERPLITDNYLGLVLAGRPCGIGRHYQTAPGWGTGASSHSSRHRMAHSPPHGTVCVRGVLL